MKRGSRGPSSAKVKNENIENMERLFKATKAHGFEVFISP